MEDLWDGFRNWWFGGGNYRPNVVVGNIDELTQGLQEFPEDETGGGYPGNAGGGGPRGRFAIGAPRTPLPATGGGAANAGNIEQLGDPRSPGWGASNLTTVTSPSGKTFRVNKWAAPAFSGFLAALEATGYVINQQESGGYNLRNIRGSSRLSQHAFGTAIDINAEENPMGGTTSNLPADISAIAARFGLNWGGNWRTRKDPMHFEWGGGNYTQSVMDSAPLGTTNNYRAGDKTVTLNAQANFNITGSEALREGGALNSAASRTNADLIRNLSPIVQ
jgi:hypothetical protein